MGTRSNLRSSVERISFHREARALEAHRVDQILARDRADYSAEIARAAANVEVSENIFVNIGDTAVPPTPEWQARFDHRHFSVGSDEQTARSVRATRRVLTPIVVRLFRSGRLDENEAKACLWYRQTWDLAMLNGRYSSSQYSDQSGGSHLQNVAAGHMAMTESEAEARLAFRLAAHSLPDEYRKFFDAVVLYDNTITECSALARCHRKRAPKRFTWLARILDQHCVKHKVELKTAGKDLLEA